MLLQEARAPRVLICVATIVFIAALSSQHLAPQFHVDLGPVDFHMGASWMKDGLETLEEVKDEVEVMKETLAEEPVEEVSEADIAEATEEVAEEEAALDSAEEELEEAIADGAGGEGDDAITAIKEDVEAIEAELPALQVR
tara:strand:+ start:95 stop:517 length:423 start_codon:yes stop_codon:yes gene_type:complete